MGKWAIVADRALCSDVYPNPDVGPPWVGSGAAEGRERPLC